MKKIARNSFDTTSKKGVVQSYFVHFFIRQIKYTSF